MSNLAQFEPIAEAITMLFHPYVEVVIHDVKENAVAAIFNNYSKRKPGADSHLENAGGLTDGPNVLGPFEKRSVDGRRIKYVSSVLRNKKGKAIGLMCINVDIHVFEQIAGALQMFLSTEDSTQLDELFDDDWQERINSFVHDYSKENRVTLIRLSKAERLDLVRALQGAGAFRAKNAANYIANVLGISRATVYNDLAKIEQD